MKNYIKHDEWLIVEQGFDPVLNRVSESIFSIGNGKIGQRANFEEDYSGDSLQGSYVAGVYYPDKTRVGWWKNGYPEYFAKVPNTTNWIGFHININEHLLDLSIAKVSTFKRELNMQKGTLYRECELAIADGSQIKVKSSRFCSLNENSIGAIQYSITALTDIQNLEVESFLDGNIRNEDSNYGESFWEGINQSASNSTTSVVLRTLKTGFTVATACITAVHKNDISITEDFTPIVKDKYAGLKSFYTLKKGETLTFYKYASVLSSLDHSPNSIEAKALENVKLAAGKGFENLKNSHAQAWAERWKEADITIQGDVAAQQAIRYNIFQLYQTYSGEDSRLNIGPKGFTGEKYGGSTYWDTEAYCLPFYQATSDASVARNLLVYRYNHLEKAIENAQKLGFTNGAALYPMVTMNGEECHNEWEITFEEIHRNGAIAYAIFDYIRYTGNVQYLAEYGLEVLIGIARFWAQRVSWSENRKAFVILGVTGPNEFENNVNNNWYTNKLASWCLSYCSKCIKQLQIDNPQDYSRVMSKTNFKLEEIVIWENICNKMYYPFDETLNIYLQQDGFLDKEQKTVADLKTSERPIVEHWSWDRILRSIFIKQADVLQGIYFFEEEFDLETIQRHFDYYEPRTVHESSLSPCVHAILAAKLGNFEKAYEFYLRTSRLDLDDYNNDTKDGLHITSMAGTWMSIVKGFAGMRVINDELHFTPFIPVNWKDFSFKLRFRGALLQITISQTETKVEHLAGDIVKTVINNDNYAKKRAVVH
jgi:maltose phosphorylase